MLTTADTTQLFLETIIEIIGRKTSQEYAAVTMRNLLKKLQPTYPFLHYIEIKNTYSLELEKCVNVDESINLVNPSKVGVVLKELTKRIMQSMGKSAGYFFIREIREKIGNEYDAMLTKSMDVNLTVMQSTYIVEKKTTSLLEIQNSDVLRRFLKTIIDVLEKQTSRTYAIRLIKQQIDSLRPQYSFLNAVMVNDIRYTLGSEEVTISTDINAINPKEVGTIIQSIVDTTDKALIAIGRNSVVSDLKANLTLEYLIKLEQMNVNIITQGVGYDAIFRQILKALIDIFSRTSTEISAIFLVNTFLGNLDTTYEFLKDVKIDPQENEGELYHINITHNINSISETEARRAIQQLILTAMDSVEETAKDNFIQNIKESLEKKYLSKIEELGVNFHMIELHRALQNKAK